MCIRYNSHVCDTDWQCRRWPKSVSPNRHKKRLLVGLQMTIPASFLHGLRRNIAAMQWGKSVGGQGRVWPCHAKPPTEILPVTELQAVGEIRRARNGGVPALIRLDRHTYDESGVQLVGHRPRLRQR